MRDARAVGAVLVAPGRSTRCAMLEPIPKRLNGSGADPGGWSRSDQLLVSVWAAGGLWSSPVVEVEGN